MKQLLAAILMVFVASAASAKSHNYWMKNINLSDINIQDNGMPGYWNWLMYNGGWESMSDYQEEKAQFIFDFINMEMPEEPVPCDNDYCEIFEIHGTPDYVVELTDNQALYGCNGCWKRGTGGIIFHWIDPTNHYSNYRTVYFPNIFNEAEGAPDWHHIEDEGYVHISNDTRFSGANKKQEIYENDEFVTDLKDIWEEYEE